MWEMINAYKNLDGNPEKIEPISNFATWWERHVNKKYLIYFVLQKHAWALDHNYLVLQSLLCPV
jgi:hypothetical protein